VSIHSTPAAVSPELAAAQAQLLQLRRHRGPQRAAATPAVAVSTPPATTQPLSPAALPPHLGWESEGYVRAQRAAAARRARHAAYEAARAYQWPTPASQTTRAQAGAERHPHVQPARPARKQANRQDTLRLFPEITLAMLREGVAATGRLWLLLQHLDEAGKGWVPEAEARRLLSQPDAPLRLCSWRQLRNLLADGDDLFWQREDGTGERRIWLASNTRVALRLGVTQLRLAPVDLPVSTLLQGIGTVRAHFYASFHSSRGNGSQLARPIARATLAALTTVSARSQRAYERRAGVRSQPNWVIGPASAPQKDKELAWRQGHALFTFVDRRGSYGPAGQRYLAWQLPNSYQGPHATKGRSPQKALNEKLVDLYSKGMAGNGRHEVEAALPPSRFYDNGRAAVRALNRGLANDAYWLTPRTERHYRIWHLLPAAGDSND
jgi:hypothetical protein